MSSEVPFDAEIAAEIAAQVAEGKSLKRIAEQEHAPASLRTIMRWSAANPDFFRALALASLHRATHLAEEAIEIADEDVVDQAQATRNRTRVTARQWLAGRLDPAKYSERLQVAAGQLAPTEELSDLEIARRLAFLLAAGEAALDREQAAVPLQIGHSPQKSPPTDTVLPPDPPCGQSVAFEVVEDYRGAEEQGHARRDSMMRAMRPLSVRRPGSS